MADAVAREPSLFFHFLLYGSVSWSVVWFIMTMALLIYKGVLLLFPPAALPMEIISAFLVLLVDVVALFFGVRGNIMGEACTLCLTVVLQLVAALGAIYYMWLQTYILLLDLVFSAILLGLNLLAALGGLYALQEVLLLKRGAQHKFAAYR